MRISDWSSDVCSSDLTTTDSRQATIDEKVETSTDSAARRCPPVFEREPQLLPVLIENAIGIGGAVRRPGAYPIASPTTAEVAINIAEGAGGERRDVVIDVTTASVSGSPALKRSDRKSTRLNSSH